MHSATHSANRLRPVSAGRRRAWVFGSLGISISALCLGAGAYLTTLNQVPDYHPPAVTLPMPNAADHYTAARLLLREPGDISPGYGRQPTTDALRRCALANRAALAQLRVGLTHRYLAPPRYGAVGPTFDSAGFRSLTRVLCAEGLLYEREGRAARSARSYLDAVRLGTTLPRGGSLIHWLTGDAIQTTGLRYLQEAEDGLDAPTARDAARELLRLDGQRVTFSEALLSISEWDRADMTRTFRKVHTLKDYEQTFLWPMGGGPPTLADWAEPAGYFLTPKRQILDAHRSYIERLAAGYRQPPYTRPTLPPVPSDPYNRISLSFLIPAGFVEARDQALLRVIAVQLAARAYALEHGAPPATIQGLVPQYLDHVPNDSFAPRPITLRLNKDRLLVYSVGPDGVDDGGTTIKGTVEAESRGDLLFVKRQK